jgi:hypothetical protein
VSTQVRRSCFLPSFLPSLPAARTAAAQVRDGRAEHGRLARHARRHRRLLRGERERRHDGVRVARCNGGIERARHFAVLGLRHELAEVDALAERLQARHVIQHARPIVVVIP